MTITAQANEIVLVSKAQNGDRNAFGELVRTHSQGVLNVVYRMCGNSDLAEDASQEAFIQAWLRLSSYKQKASFRSWVYRIAVNTAIDMLRKEKRILPNSIEDMNLSASTPSPEMAVANSERAELVREAVIKLPSASRAVLVLREYEGFSYQEISEALEIPMGTVMSRLNYARKLLKENLETHLFSNAEVENV